jgi:hypothetical protein
MSSVCLLIADGIFRYEFSLQKGKQTLSSKFSKIWGGAFGKSTIFCLIAGIHAFPTQRVL